MTVAQDLRVAHPDSALFASDMHLDATRPALTTRFIADLDRRLGVRRASAEAPTLFLLGDLFEYWVGDDHLTAPAIAIAAVLAKVGAAGTRVFLMHGNRDFLIDAELPADPARRLRFSNRCQASLLTEPVTITVGERRIGLCHGDALCTDDVFYQQWRAQCRSAAWQRTLLEKPIAERVMLARALREQSRRHQAGAIELSGAVDQTGANDQTEAIGDVNQAAVDATMTALDVDLLIHGHTHRPALHRWQFDTGERLRWVLSDWATNPDRGAVMSLTEGLALA